MPITICRCSKAVDGSCMNLYPGHPHYGTCRCPCHSRDHEPGLLDDIDGDLSEMEWLVAAQREYQRTHPPD